MRSGAAGRLNCVCSDVKKQKKIDIILFTQPAKILQMS